MRKKAQPKKPALKSVKTPAMEKTVTRKTENQFEKFAHDAAAGGQEQIEIIIRSGGTLMKGAEELSKAYMEWAQSAAENNAQALKALMACKTMTEMTQAQSKWAQQGFDDFMAGATRLSELGTKLATEAFEPVSDQFGKAMKKAGASLAA